MKTLKFALITALIACTMVSFANADGIKEKPKFKRVVNMTLDKVIQNPGLEKAVYLQVHRDDVLIAHLHVFVAEVVYQGITYRISGTFDEWMRFFVMDGLRPVNTKYRGVNTN